MSVHPADRHPLWSQVDLLQSPEKLKMDQNGSHWIKIRVWESLSYEESKKIAYICRYSISSYSFPRKLFFFSLEIVANSNTVFHHIVSAETISKGRST